MPYTVGWRSLDNSENLTTGIYFFIPLELIFYQFEFGVSSFMRRTCKPKANFYIPLHSSTSSYRDSTIYYHYHYYYYYFDVAPRTAAVTPSSAALHNIVILFITVCR